jgi:hypothetical protein
VYLDRKAVAIALSPCWFTMLAGLLDHWFLSTNKLKLYIFLQGERYSFTSSINKNSAKTTLLLHIQNNNKIF